MLAMALSSVAAAQKKPLDHSVYDRWQHVGEKLISSNGQWVVYTVEPQEGDGILYALQPAGEAEIRVPRGYLATITADSRFLVCRVKAPWSEIRAARIRKAQPADLPLDSLFIVELSSGNTRKFARVKNHQLPEEGRNYVAFTVLNKSPQSPGKANREIDSLKRVIDSLERLVNRVPKRKRKSNSGEKNDMTVEVPAAVTEEEKGVGIASLYVYDMHEGTEKSWEHVSAYQFSRKGNHLLVKLVPPAPDSSHLFVYQLPERVSRTIIHRKGEVKTMAISANGSRTAFVGDFGKKRNDGLPFYRLYQFVQGGDSAQMIADRFTPGMPLGQTVSEHASLRFSDSGERIFFGTSFNPVPRDTTVPEIDIPRLDLWHYNDDYLQTVQTLPARLRAAQQQSFLAFWDGKRNRIVSLACEEVPVVMATPSGDGRFFAGFSDLGKRVSAQWDGYTRRDVYAIDTWTGEQILLKKNLHGNIYPSPGGSVLAWFDRDEQAYHAWDGRRTARISGALKTALGNEENDLPGPPNNYGLMGWHENDRAIYVYDRYDAYRLDVKGEEPPLAVTRGIGRNEKIVFRYHSTDTAKQFFTAADFLLFRSVNDQTKKQGFRFFRADGGLYSSGPGESGYSYDVMKIARHDPFTFIYTKENFTEPPNLHFGKITQQGLAGGEVDVKFSTRALTDINPQQSSYNWGRAELFQWKAYDGREASGIVYKPEDFDPGKKYPVIVYFYERLSQTLYDYKEPAPIRSAVNIPFFVSRGYILFLPDIRYEVGRPGQSAYDYIVSGTRALARLGFADTTRMALQGHSWGGYQAVQLATMTPLFRAVWAGAPVVNMTSAYGGIRYESGVSRQFQYEQTQSRIGGNLWDKLPLYIENSPLFHLPKVKAPIVILHNDADGAVPWTQGIELFTALRRLGKKTWLLNYNGQGHGLTQRQDMRDYHIRMQQFFDWQLKNAPPARWITEGIPAVDKGRDLGY